MKSYALVLAASGILILTFSCAPPVEEEAPVAEQVPSAETDLESIHELVRQWDEALNTRNVDASVSLYAEDPVAMPPFTPMVSGGEAIREWFEAFHAQGALDVKNEVADVDMSGDWAAARGTFTLTLTPEAGEAVQDTGNWLATFRRGADGTWKVERNIWNSDNPPPSASPLEIPEEVETLPAEAEQCVQELTGLDDAFVAAFTAGNVGELLALHGDRALRMPPGRTHVEGKHALTAYFTFFVESFETRELRISQTGSHPANALGATWGTFELAYTPTGGGDPLTDKGKYVAIGSQQDDGCWRYEWVIWNSDVAAQGSGG